jgi:hypothetical protein
LWGRWINLTFTNEEKKGKKHEFEFFGMCKKAMDGGNMCDLNVDSNK